MTTILLGLVVIAGLLAICACGFWVMSNTAVEGSFRIQAPNLRACPQCGAALDHQLDHCAKCSLRVSV